MAETRGPGREGPEEPAIVVGVDGSERSRWALKWATDEAKHRGAVLTILFAHSSKKEADNTPPWYDAVSADGLSPGEAIVDDAFALAATRHPSVVVRAEVVPSSPAMALTEASGSADLLVVGARGRGGFAELLLGSVSDQCIQHAHCPVVVVHTDPDGTARAAEPQIVVGIDGSLGSTRALKWALAEARWRSASILGVHAWQFPPIGTFLVGPRQGYDAAAHEVLNAAVDYAADRAPEVPIDVVADCEDAVPALLAASSEADLLVVGADGHRGFKGALVGSVAHQCARHARCAVVVVRLTAPDEDPARTTQARRAARSDDGDMAGGRGLRVLTSGPADGKHDT